MLEREVGGLISKLANYTGIPLDEIQRREIEILSRVLSFDITMEELDSTPDINLSFLFKKYLARGGKDGLFSESLFGGRRFAERKHSFIQLAEAVLGIFPSVCTYGLYLPSYLEMLTKHRDGAAPLNPTHKALMVGALTKNTIEEYKATVKLVYPEALTYVVDLDGDETSQAEGFCFGDGLSLPFNNSVFDTIHTNFLLRDHFFLRSRQTRDEARKAFFAETFRALSPGGSLIMIEGDSGRIFPDLKTEIDEKVLEETGARLSHEAQQAGFSQSYFTQARLFSNWRLVFRFLDGDLTVLEGENTLTAPNTLGLFFLK